MAKVYQACSKYCAQIIANQSQDGTAWFRTMLVIGITCVFERHCPSKCDVQSFIPTDFMQGMWIVTNRLPNQVSKNTKYYKLTVIPRLKFMFCLFWNPDVQVDRCTLATSHFALFLQLFGKRLLCSRKPPGNSIPKKQTTFKSEFVKIVMMIFWETPPLHQEITLPRRCQNSLRLLLMTPPDVTRTNSIQMCCVHLMNT